MSRVPNRITRRIALAVVAAAVVAVASPTALATPGKGKPTVERAVVEEAFFDDFTLDICGVATNTTLTQRTTTQTWPDGSQTVHIVAEFVPENPSIASERFARTDLYEPDGSVTIKGLAIRLYRNGEGTIIRDAGWVRFMEDGLVVRGPHPFLETDPAEVYC
jgi:hypothetical protein